LLHDAASRGDMPRCSRPCDKELICSAVRFPQDDELILSYK
jgi:hypothetical protein